MNNDVYGSRPGQAPPPSAKPERRDLLSVWWRFERIGCRCLAIIATVLIVWGSIVSAALTLLPMVPGTERALKAPILSSMVPAMVPAKDRPTQLGQPVTNFVKTYGQPTFAFDASYYPGYYFRQETIYVTKASNWDITPISKDDSLVMDVYDQNTDGKGWANIDEAAQTCEAYMPKDAKLQEAIDQPADPKQGIRPSAVRIYTSSSLASLFQASDFTDQAIGKSVPPGTFVIDYSGDNANSQHIKTCDLTIAVYSSNMIKLLAGLGIALPRS